ncbi:MAG: phage tail protein [Candidatus Neomarinimicrobiota bacterium]|tara:strand:- start:229 stop:810 length:582 start_codon:yes stop_codon:yes gene_type:complete
MKKIIIALNIIFAIFINAQSTQTQRSASASANVNAQSNSYKLSGTFGQAAVGLSLNNSVKISSGYWGWLVCDGSAVSRSTYSALFSAIGTTYGTGDGSSTFNLPNFGGKGPMGYKSNNAKFDALNETGGAETHTLTANEIPSHTIYSSKTMQGIGTNQGNYSLVGNISTTTYGAGAAHNILDPYLTVNFIIKQ